MTNDVFIAAVMALVAVALGFPVVILALIIIFRKARHSSNAPKKHNYS